MGKRCDTCDFLYLSSSPEMHSGTICAEYRALKRKYRLSSTDYHRILNQMIDGGLLLDSNDSISKAESESGENSGTNHSDPKRRKKRKREEVTTNSNQSEDDLVTLAKKREEDKKHRKRKFQYDGGYWGIGKVKIT